ncbi:MAG: gluconate 2-dehydrogenase subunit 3 family protein [Rhodothermales bacterium]|nr:gluconate 2-dehydrogenase subunit 3 family protein [Rhodothermales bacterium]MBO6778161.1 gluconate 2-dehydrogenase subunit 3 family protein [Rhodothermales bacterium]
MDRRDALRRISLLLGAAISAPTAAGLLAGCRAGGGSYQPRALATDEYRFMGRLAEAIIPQTDTAGALAAGVDEFIDAMLVGYYPTPELNAFRSAVPPLRRRLEDEQGLIDMPSLVTLDSQAFEQDPGPREMGADFSDIQAYRRVKELVVAGYYTSQIAESEELRPTPMGQYRGDIPLEGRTWA